MAAAIAGTKPETDRGSAAQKSAAARRSRKTKTSSAAAEDGRVVKAQRTMTTARRGSAPTRPQIQRTPAAAPARRTVGRRIQREGDDEMSIVGAGVHKLTRTEIDAIVAALEDRILEDLARRGGRYLGQF